MLCFRVSWLHLSCLDMKHCSHLWIQLNSVTSDLVILARNVYFVSFLVGKSKVKCTGRSVFMLSKVGAPRGFLRNFNLFGELQCGCGWLWSTWVSLVASFVKTLDIPSFFHIRIKSLKLCFPPLLSSLQFVFKRNFSNMNIVKILLEKENKQYSIQLFFSLSLLLMIS